jgi:hypothetical protein
MCEEENSKCWFCREVLDPYETVYVWEDVEIPTGWEQVFVCGKCNAGKGKVTL